MRFLVLLAALALTACTSTLGRYVPKQEELDKSKSLMYAQMACINSAAKNLDDGISAANIIADAIYARCAEKIDASLLAYAQTTSQDQRFINGMMNDPDTKAMQYKLITNAVLQYRGQLRSQK